MTSATAGLTVKQNGLSSLTRYAPFAAEHLTDYDQPPTKTGTHKDEADSKVDTKVIAH